VHKFREHEKLGLKRFVLLLDQTRLEYRLECMGLLSPLVEHDHTTMEKLLTMVVSDLLMQE